MVTAIKHVPFALLVTLDAFLLMMEDQTRPRQLYNVGNPVEFTVKDLAKKIIKLTNSKARNN